MWKRRYGAPILAGASIGALTLRRWLRQSLPPVDGTLAIEGISCPAEIRRDAWGIPHINASNPADLFFAQGFVHASDRLWQMEVWRRVAAGRLAEIVGERGLAGDRLLRRVGLRHIVDDTWRALKGEEQEVLTAYASGVNTYLQQAKALPLEFRLLRLEPEPWSPADSLAWARLMAFALTPNWDVEIVRYALLDEVGVDQAVRFDPDFWSTNRIGIEQIAADFAAVRSVIGFESAGASNAWVVDSHRSETGAPILANDPHLPPVIPPFWYTIQLCSPEFRLTGASLPGIPGIIIGHNQRIAWGVTAGLADAADLFAERLDAAGRRYEVDGQWRDCSIREELIRVRGRHEPEIETVIATEHGPILTPPEGPPALRNVLGKPVVPPLALRSPVLDREEPFQAGFNLWSAQNWEQFCTALEGWTAPNQNFVYADVDGNIGYVFAGRIPIRRRGLGLMPLVGWDSEFDWEGYIPASELPRSFNPPEGFYVSANQNPAPMSYRYHLGQDFAAEYRCRRIRDLLVNKHRHSVTTFAAMQQDVLTLPGIEIQRYYRDVHPRDAASKEVLDVFVAWDGRLSQTSVGATIYETLRWLLIQHFAARTLGPTRDALVGPSPIPASQAQPHQLWLTRWLLQLLEQPRSTGMDFGAIASILTEALASATAHLEATLGPHPDRWQWGRIHRVTFQHTFGEVPIIGRLFNRGPFPIGGDVDTIMQSGMPLAASAPPTQVPSYRLIVDLDDFDRSIAVLPGGQSGQPVSRHYDDQLPLWRQGRYVPLLSSDDAVRGATVSTLTLRPKK